MFMHADAYDGMIQRVKLALCYIFNGKTNWCTNWFVQLQREAGFNLKEYRTGCSLLGIGVCFSPAL